MGGILYAPARTYWELGKERIDRCPIATLLRRSDKNTTQRPASTCPAKRAYVREMQSHLQEMEEYLRRMRERLRRLDKQLSHLEAEDHSALTTVH